MFRPVQLFIGLRYLRAKRRSNFVSFISMISLAGIAIGVAALIIVLSVMNGFGNELRERLVSLTAHVTISGADGVLADWPEVRARAATLSGVGGAAPFIEGQGMLVRGRQLSGVLLTGVVPAEEPAVSGIETKMVAGRLDSLRPGVENIVLGRVLADTLGARPGDRINVLIPQPGASFMPRLRRYTVSGIFEIGIEAHDGSRALLHLDDAAIAFGLDGVVSGVRLRLADLFAAPRVSAALEQTLGSGYRVDDWTRQQASFFRAIKIEKLMMFIILSLIVAVAVFNILATLAMVVADKRADIAILRTLGLEPGRVMSVFVIQGLVIGMIGTLIGLALGVGLALNLETLVPRLEALLGVQLIPADVYYVTSVPSELRWNEVAGIGLTAFALATLATLYPSWRAARTHPAEALRYD